MAAMLVSRVLLPQRLSQHLPKVPWVRMLSSDTSDNGEKPKISVEGHTPTLSDLKETLKGISTEASRPVVQEVKGEKEKVVKKSFLEILVPKVSQTKGALIKGKENGTAKKGEGKISVGGILSFLAKPSQEPIGNKSLKSIRERSLGNASELRKSIMGDKTNVKFPAWEGERSQWIEKSLEDFEKAQTNSTTAKAQKTDPKLNEKIKKVLSGLQVGPQKSGTAERLVAAAENWGKTLNTRKRLIQEEYLQQTTQNLSEAPSWVSFDEGEKTGLFDNVFKEAKHGKLNPISQSDFLFHLFVTNRFQTQESVGVLRNSFSEQVRLSNRLWTYPIDNEVCNSVEEQNTSFEEHVFLEYLLDEFPNKGPVRRFMELVINGLQKNPFLTVAQKKERVGWFHNYFANFSEEDLNF